MPIKVACPRCGKQLTAPDALGGQERTCPACRAKIAIPGAQPQATTAPPVKEPASESPLIRPAAGPPRDLIDLTAMVDIVFFMLVFFLVTSLSALEAVINLPNPEGEASASATAMPIDITNDPTYIMVVIDEEDTVWVEDEEVFGEQNLRSRLRALKAEGDDRNGMLVVGDPEATHGTLVMVLDAGADAGLTELMFSVGEAPEDQG